MRLFWLAGFVLGLASATLAEEPIVGYHEKVGIPLAAEIKTQEENIFRSLARSDPEMQDGRIVGGAVATANAHPYLGGLIIEFVNVAGQSVCGSSLLSSNRLVTAAHCWFDGSNQASRFTVVLGSQFLFLGGGIRVPTSQVIMHPQWSPSALMNDIAMIYLPYSVSLSNIVQPVALPSGAQLWDTFAGQLATAAGYGKTSDSQAGVSQSTLVMQVNLQVITNAVCQQTFGGWVTTGNVCTSGQGGVGICGGDSGGPLVVNQGGVPTLIGVSSFVAGTGCQLSYPSAFARITNFYNFIMQHM